MGSRPPYLGCFFFINLRVRALRSALMSGSFELLSGSSRAIIFRRTLSSLEMTTASRCTSPGRFTKSVPESTSPRATRMLIPDRPPLRGARADRHPYVPFPHFSVSYRYILTARRHATEIGKAGRHLRLGAAIPFNGREVDVGALMVARATKSSLTPQRRCRPTRCSSRR